MLNANKIHACDHFSASDSVKHADFWKSLNDGPLNKIFFPAFKLDTEANYFGRKANFRYIPHTFDHMLDCQNKSTCIVGRLS